LLHHAHFDVKDGKPSFTASTTNGSYAQKLTFAKLAPRAHRHVAIGPKPPLADVSNAAPQLSHCRR